MTVWAVLRRGWRPPRPAEVGRSVRAGAAAGLLVGLAEALRVVFRHLDLATPRHQLVHAVWILAATMQFFILGGFLLGLAYAWCLSRAGWHRPEEHPWAHALFLNWPLLNVLVFLVPLNHALPEINSLKSILGNLAFLVPNLGLYPAGMALAAKCSSPLPPTPRPGKRGSNFKFLGAVEGLALLGLLFAREAGPSRPAGTPASIPAASSRPNLVLITVDAFRADRLPCSSRGRTLTPNLFGLAQQSTCFEHAYTQGSHTSASFPALFLSMYADELGQGPFLMMGEERTALAEMLRDQGYRTAALVGNNPFLQSRFGYGQGFETYSVALFDPFPGLFERINFSLLGDLLYQALYVGHLYLTGSRGSTKQILDQALAWLGQPDPAQAGSFFLWIHLMNLHAPYGGRFLQSSIEFLDPGYQGRFRNSYAAQDAAVSASLSPRELLHIRTLYDAGLILVDEQIGRLLQFLHQHGVFDQTLIIVTGDHGECLGEHQHFQHDEMWEEVIRVPLLIKLPGQTQARVLEENYRLLDVAPTVLDLLGAAPALEMQGQSFLASLRAGPEAGRPVFVTRTNPQADLAALVLGRAKLIFHPRTGQAQLFDLAADPKEQTDLAEQEPRRRDELRAILQAHLEQVQRIRGRLQGGRTFEPERLTPTERGSLQALGYAEALRPAAQAPAGASLPPIRVLLP